jgi:site-specific DNA-cytosine methylase
MHTEPLEFNVALNVLPTDVMAITPPCTSFSSELNNGAQRGMEDDQTAALSMEISMAFGMQKFQLVLFESVCDYFQSEAWMLIKAGMQVGGYVWVDTKFTLQMLGLPTRRERGYALAIKKEHAARITQGLTQLKHEIGEESKKQLPLDQCYVESDAQLKRYKLDGLDVVVFRVLSDACEASLVRAKECAREKCPNIDTGHYILDLGKSNARTLSHPTEGMCPCITKANAWLRLYSTKHRRFLFPHELMHIMGFESAGITCASDVAFAHPDGPKAGWIQMAHGIGNSTSPAAWRVLVKAAFAVAPQPFVGPFPKLCAKDFRVHESTQTGDSWHAPARDSLRAGGGV